MTIQNWISMMKMNDRKFVSLAASKFSYANSGTPDTRRSPNELEFNETVFNYLASNTALSDFFYCTDKLNAIFLFRYFQTGQLV